MQATTFDSYGKFVDYSILVRVEEIAAAAKDAELDLLNAGFLPAVGGDSFPFAYEIEDLRERDQTVDDRASLGNFAGLRRSKNGRELLALWKARTHWRDERAQAQDQEMGFVSAGLASPEAEFLRRLTMHDGEFTYCLREDTADEAQFEAWEKQDEFVKGKLNEKRAELILELRRRGVDPRNPLVVRWVEKRMAAKSWNQLRAYSSCLYIIRRGFPTGFAYRKRLASQ
jgi:hypothetical protein